MTDTPREHSPMPTNDQPEHDTPPKFNWAGGTMSGENVIECDQCGALIRESNAFLHQYWHDRLSNMRVVQ